MPSRPAPAGERKEGKNNLRPAKCGTGLVDSCGFFACDRFVSVLHVAFDAATQNGERTGTDGYGNAQSDTVFNKGRTFVTGLKTLKQVFHFISHLIVPLCGHEDHGWVSDPVRKGSFMEQ